MQKFLPTDNCPVRDILSKLGDKWPMLVMITLHSNDVMRFSDIHRTIGDISHRMLTVTLKSLEADGLVDRKVYAEIPPRVEYRLTDMGLSLLPHLQNLVSWALDNLPEIMESRKKSKSQ